MLREGKKYSYLGNIILSNLTIHTVLITNIYIAFTESKQFSMPFIVIVSLIPYNSLIRLIV